MGALTSRLLCPSLVPSLLLSLAAGLVACAEEPVDSGYDPEQVIAEAVAFETELERLDAEMIPTIHGMGPGYAEIWANEAAAEVFRSIDGDDLNATAEFPRGALLVKNNLDADGEPVGMLTIMAKFESGYYPEANDWFFAAVDLEGEVIDGMAGNGVDIYSCYDCHAQMGANTDLIIGLAPDQLR